MKYLLVFLALVLSGCSSDHPSNDRPLVKDQNEVGRQKVLIEWHPEGFYVGVEEYGISCGWYGEIGNWLIVHDLNTPKPYINYNFSKMLCTPLIDSVEGWNLQCSQAVNAKYLGRYNILVDFYVRKEATPLGNKGSLHWTLDGVDLNFWCVHSLVITDERPHYD